MTHTQPHTTGAVRRADADYAFIRNKPRYRLHGEREMVNLLRPGKVEAVCLPGFGYLSVSPSRYR